jgi:hypothetical protein
VTSGSTAPGVVIDVVIDVAIEVVVVVVVDECELLITAMPSRDEPRPCMTTRPAKTARARIARADHLAGRSGVTSQAIAS